MLKSATVPVKTQEELGGARRLVSQWADRLAFSSLDRTRFVTAASELGRNALVHGGGGTMTITEVFKGEQPGLQLDFADEGPGIADLGQAMTDGYSTARSLGLGLGGARRLVSEFNIISHPGTGTRVTVIQWKRR